MTMIEKELEILPHQAYQGAEIVGRVEKERSIEAEMLQARVLAPTYSMTKLAAGDHYHQTGTPLP